jgi:DNA-binding response OmpR family regulator
MEFIDTSKNIYLSSETFIVKPLQGPTRIDRAVARMELLCSVWGYDAETVARTVDVHIAGLRRKLENDPGSPRVIITILSIGYRFDGKRK